MSLEQSPIGATLTYRPHGAFLPHDLEFPWATPDDIAFVLVAFRARQLRGGKDHEGLDSVMADAHESQLLWHEHRVRQSVLKGLGWWAKLMPKRVDRAVELVMRQYHESMAQWTEEMARLHEQVNHLSARVGSDRRTPVQRVATGRPHILCAGGCRKSIPLQRPLDLPPGWTLDRVERPLCPEHSADNVTTSSRETV